MESSSQNNYVKLEPFIHQVGGHSSMLCLDERTVCKPLVERELQFYETLPEPLKRFVPSFYGVLRVKILPEDDSYVALIALPPERYSPRTTNNKQKIRIRRTGSIEIEGGIQDLFEEEEGSCEFVQETNKHGAAINPWVFKCHQNQLRKMISSIKDDDTQPNFILLENLTWKFNFPCILDLKMGTRQYGDNASLPKKQSKMFKVVSTTSGKLGVRIGGMQVYQVTTHQFLCRNKFFGRSLSVGGFQQALRQFLHNGSRLRSDVLAPLIRRLEDLVGILTLQESVRFYTTSLLLIYDGLDLSCGQEKYFMKDICKELFRNRKRSVQAPGVHASFGQVFTSLKIILTTPMSTAEPERFFSFLKRIKPLLRNTMAAERLSALAMVNIEIKMIANIENFNRKVIEKFINLKERRLHFHFK